MNLIAAVDKNWGLGYRGQLLVRIPADLKLFRELTLNKVVVMGRKTLESLPGGQPLDKRTNIVLSRRCLNQQGITQCKSLEDLLKVLAVYRPEDIFIIGGAQIYSQLLPYCSRAYITKIEKEFTADVFLPNLDKDEEWVIENPGELNFYDGIAFKYVLYTRKV